MKDFEQFLENKESLYLEGLDSSKVRGLQDLAEALRSVFKKYAKNTRKEIWEKLLSPKGKTQINRIINDPWHNEISDSIIRTLWNQK